MGAFLIQTHAYQHGLEINHSALHLAEQAGLPDLQVDGSLNIGLCLAGLVEFEAAERYMSQSLHIAQAHHITMSAARVEMNLGDLAAAQGQPAKALRYLESARRSFLDMNNALEAGTVLWCEGTLFGQMGAYRAASRYLSQAAVIFEQQGLIQEQAFIQLALADAYSKSGQLTSHQRTLNRLESFLHASGLDTSDYWADQVWLEKVGASIRAGNGQQASALLNQRSTSPKHPVLSLDFRYLQVEAERLIGLHTPDRLDGLIERYKAVCDDADTRGGRWHQRRALVGLGKTVA